MSNNSNIELKFLGGAEEVGRLGMVFRYGKVRFLFDYGISPTDPPQYPIGSPNVDAVFLSHAHLDHSGLIPQHAGYYQNPIYTTPPSTQITELLIRDSLKIADYEGYPKRFSLSDITLMNQSFMPVSYNESHSFGDGMSVTSYSAGHIPGSAMFEVDVGGTRTLFTGDINTIDTKLVRKVQPVKCDNLILESTYAGREHPPRTSMEQGFLSSVEEVIARGGRVIVPAFAVGRCQEVLMLLGKTDYEVWLDGMGVKVVDMFLDHGSFLSNASSLANSVKKARKVRNPFDRRKALNGDIIITTSGMLDGGPVHYYLTHFLKDKNSALFLTGYQVKDTNGRRLLDTGKVLINGVELTPQLEIKFFDFSAHAGHTELKEFAYKSNPENIILMHGDNRELLAREFEKDFKVHLPLTGEKLVV